MEHESIFNLRSTAARRFQPDRVQLLLVVDAPPTDPRRYFYFTDVAEHDSLFRYVHKGLFGSVPARTEKEQALQRLKEEGVFLIDFNPDPTRIYSLSERVADLVRRCKALNPRNLILIKATVFDSVAKALDDGGLPVVGVRIPFPGSGQQKAFEREFTRALKAANWRPTPLSQQQQRDLDKRYAAFQSSPDEGYSIEEVEEMLRLPSRGENAGQ